MIQAFPDRVRQLAHERGLSVSRVLHDAWDPRVRGTSPDLARKVFAGRRALTPTLIEAIADALGVPPEEFPEYRLAMARLALDEREVGLDQAMRALNRMDEALRAQLAASAHPAVEPVPGGRRPGRAALRVAGRAPAG